jgi:NADH-quinone oxidoreductase subunit G
MSNANLNPPVPEPVPTIRVKIDGRTVEVPKLVPQALTGKLAPTTMIQACEHAGVEIPHYCYHPKLPVAGNCRMCLVEFGTPALGPDRKPLINPDGTPVIAKAPNPAIACASPISSGMEIYTQTANVKSMRQAVLEFLLINHPLDCPICDQAGECKLQEYSVEYGQAASGFAENKVHKPKQVDLGPRIMLDNERCILCSRCIRFTRDIAHDDALGIMSRGGHSAITTYPGRAFDNNYTLNTVDICPVGALTSKDFRFQMRVWFLKETKSVCTSCGTGCNILIGSRENRIYRYTPRENEAVNSCWMCDAGRLNYKWIGRTDRLVECRIRKDGEQRPATWAEALQGVGEVLRRAVSGSVAIIASARQTNEELYLIRKIADRLNSLSDAIPRTGAGDALLVNADKNCNSNGARLTGAAQRELGSNLANIAEGIDRGEIKTLLVIGEDLVRHWGEERLRKLDTLVVSDILPNATVSMAHFVLPGCAHAEKRGTFTNVKGRVQRFWAAVTPPEDARPEIEFLREILMRLGGGEIPENMEGIFNLMAEETRGYRGLTWAGLGDGGVTVALDEGETKTV